MEHRMRLCTAPLYLLLLISICVEAFLPEANGGTYTLSNLGAVSSVQTLEGGSVTLFCDTTPEIHNDEFTILVWYKDNFTIYSLEIPDQEWSDPSFNTSSRLQADIRSQPTSITVSSLTHDDEGMYQCRVDFKLSPTRNLGINLTVVVLPSTPFFMDERNNKVVGRVGPYHQGDTLIVRCLVIGGHPPPRISWYSGDTLVDSSDGNSDIPSVRENELYMPVTRDNCAAISCIASNTDLAPPIVSSLEIELYMSAYNVTMSWVRRTIDNTLPAGSVTQVQCIAYGSYPQPELSWWLNHKELTLYSNQTWNNSSLTAVSFLELIPTVRDNGATLACVAINPVIAKTSNKTAFKSDQLTLNVTYSPIANVIYNNGTGGEPIEMGPLQLECNISANPPVEKIMWYFNDIKIKPGSIWGDRIYSQKLHIKIALRMHSGRYACAATNALGETKSDFISIAILYPPECIGIGIRLIKETIYCNVKGLPLPNTYVWQLQPSNFEVQNLTTMSSTLPLDQITGPLVETMKASCEGSNGIGSQNKKCSRTFSFQHLRPSQPHQCDIAYEFGEFQMKCLPVHNAIYYDVSVWRTFDKNSTLILERKANVGFGKGQALTATGSDYNAITERHDVEMSLGQMRRGDQAGAKACNRYGCSIPLLLRPTDYLLSKAELSSHLTRNVGLSVAAVILIAVFIITTLLSVRLTRRRRSNPPPVIQVLQLDDVTGNYLNTAEHRINASCSLRSCSSIHSDASGNFVAPKRRRRSTLERHDCPRSEITLSLHRESDV